MKLSNLTIQSLGTLRARDLISSINAENNKATSIMSLIMADTCDRALSKGDEHAAEFFFKMAVEA